VITMTVDWVEYSC